MKRAEFTKTVMLLLHEMIANGDEPVIDYALRSAEEQKRLFDKGLSKCDGTKIKSAHQIPKAIDIYFSIDGSIDFGYGTERAKLLADKYHKYWQQLGGKPIIEWDKCHYEVP